MSRTFAAVALLSLLVVWTGCQTSRKITRRDELENPLRTGPITVYAADHRIIELRTYELGDSLLRGSGSLITDGTRVPFQGEIPLDSIAAISVNSRSALRAMVATGSIVLVASAVLSGFEHDRTGMSAEEQVTHHYPGGGGGGGGDSCPYVYAWNGKRFVLEAEPFGVGLGKALELTTWHLLPSARAENGSVRLRLTNERLETHHVNSLRLYAIEAGDAAEVVLDEDGTAWPLSHREAPVFACDAQGRSILSEVAAVDGRAWECPASSLAPGSGYEDQLELAFVRPPGAKAGSLVLTGINTALSTVVFGQLCRIAGDQALPLVHAIDTDPELIARLREYRADASLKVSVWNGKEWTQAGSFCPEAVVVTFTRTLRVELPGDIGDTVRIRLRSMSDVWKIDALAADWTDAAPLPARPVELLSAVGPNGEEMRSLIEADDDRYATLIPPDQVDLTFAATAGGTGSRIVYAVAGRGYLHEWIPTPPPGGRSTLAAMVPKEKRIDFLKEALKHRELVLQSVYEEWAAKRE